MKPLRTWTPILGTDDFATADLQVVEIPAGVIAYRIRIRVDDAARIALRFADGRLEDRFLEWIDRDRVIARPGPETNANVRRRLGIKEERQTDAQDLTTWIGTVWGLWRRNRVRHWHTIARICWKNRRTLWILFHPDIDVCKTVSPSEAMVLRARLDRLFARIRRSRA